MRYQLVLQFPGDSPADFDTLLTVEEKLAAMLSDVADVDGHDIGSGEANIFVLTDDPRDTFDKALPVLKDCADVDSMRAAFREITGETYTVLWPRDFRGKFAVA